MYFVQSYTLNMSLGLKLYARGIAIQIAIQYSG